MVALGHQQLHLISGLLIEPLTDKKTDRSRMTKILNEIVNDPLTFIETLKALLWWTEALRR